MRIQLSPAPTVPTSVDKDGAIVYTVAVEGNRYTVVRIQGDHRRTTAGDYVNLGPAQNMAVLQAADEASDGHTVQVRL